MKEEVDLFSALHLNFLKRSVKKTKKKLIKMINVRILVAAFGNMIGIFFNLGESLSVTNIKIGSVMY